MRQYVKVVCAAVAVVGLFTTMAVAGATKRATWLGNGATSGSPSWTLNNVQCDASSTPYLLFVLAGTKSLAANIRVKPTGGRLVTGAMKRTNVDAKGFATFQYLYRPGANIDLSKYLTKVTATYSDTTAKNVAFNISHGCLGATAPTLPITFLGEADSSFVALGGSFTSRDYPASSVTFCETSTTNCVSFAAGDLPGTVHNLTLANAHSTIDVSGSGFCKLYLSNSAFGAVNGIANTWLPTDILGGAYPTTTSTTFSNGDAGIFWYHNGQVCAG